MRFRPVTSSTPTEATAAPLQSTYSSPSPRKKGRKFPLKVLNLSPVPHADDSLSPYNKRSPKRQKRHKAEPVIELTYPTEHVNVPSRTTIQALYECAMEKEDSHQARHLAGTGLLSLEDVLLPAMMQQELEALKRVQAKAQRDSSTEAAVSVLVECRRALYETAQAGVRTAREARLVRQQRQAERDAARQEEQRRAREEARLEQREVRRRRREEERRRKAEERERRMLELKKKLPRNVELFREYAMLMAELAKLQKEERMWKDAEQSLVQREQELERQEALVQKEAPKENEAETGVELSEHELGKRADQAMQHISVSSIRVEQAAQLVSKLMAETDVVREELYNKYKDDHQFHGYRGVKNPKALLRAIAMH